MPTPQKKSSLFVEQASCLFLTGGQDAHPTKKNSLFVEQASCLFLTEARCQIYEALGCFKLPNKLRVSLAATFIACSALILPVKAELK